MRFDPVTIRKAREDDVDVLIDVALAACLSSIAHLPEFRDRQHEMRGAFERFVPEQLDSTILIERNGETAGLLSVEVSRGEITDVWVRPDHQGMGIGASLMAAGESAARQAGQTCTWLTCHHENQHALRFYRAQGYALLSIEEHDAESLVGVRYPRALLGKQLSRPHAPTAADMAGVRAGIDMLDPMLVSLIAERFAFIDRAAEVKEGTAIPARVTPRVEQVVSNARKQALAIGFDPDLTETLWRTMVELAIAREEIHLGGDLADTGS
ncbi:MAG: GNAT family N-acetyltransferase [Pseudomonadota bacterium]